MVLIHHDTHMIKNMEWGAVAYLTSSKYVDIIGIINISHQDETWINNVNTGTE